LSAATVVGRPLASLGKDERPTTGSDEGNTTPPKHFLLTVGTNSVSFTVEIESGIQVAPRCARWRSNAVHLNGGDRILSNGTPHHVDNAEWMLGDSAFSRFRPLTEALSWMRALVFFAEPTATARCEMADCKFNWSATARYSTLQ
jgi:hypothetical protein